MGGKKAQHSSKRRVVVHYLLANPGSGVCGSYVKGDGMAFRVVPWKEWGFYKGFSLGSDSK